MRKRSTTEKAALWFLGFRGQGDDLTYMVHGFYWRLFTPEELFGNAPLHWSQQTYLGQPFNFKLLAKAQITVGAIFKVAAIGGSLYLGAAGIGNALDHQLQRSPTPISQPQEP